MGGRDGDRAEPGGRWKISQAALFAKIVRMIVDGHTLSLPAQHTPFPQNKTLSSTGERAHAFTKNEKNRGRYAPKDFIC